MFFNFKFSIVMTILNNEKYPEKTIQSVINQDICFKDNVQLILVNEGIKDDSYDISLKYQDMYPQNIIALTKDNGNQESARNLGLKYADAEYINFLDNDDELSPNVLSSVYDFFSAHIEEIDLVSIPLVYSDSENEGYLSNQKSEEDGIVDLIKNPEYSQLSLSSSFLKNEIFHDFKFDTNLSQDEDSIIINKILLNKKKYGQVNKTGCFCLKRCEESSTLDMFRYKNEYLNIKLNNYKSLIDYSLDKEGNVADFIQYLMVDEMQHFYKISDFPEDMCDEEIEEFWRLLYYILDNIDKKIIFKHPDIKKVYIKRFLIYLKNHKDFNIIVKPNKSKVFLKSDNNIINRLHNHRFHFDIIEFKEGCLNFSGNFVCSCIPEALTVKAIKTLQNGSKEVFTAKKVEYPTTNRKDQRFLGIDWRFNYNFDLKVPMNKNEQSKIDFFMVYEENGEKVEMKNNIVFRKHADLSEISNYFIKDSLIVLFEENSFYTLPYSYHNVLKLEINTIKELYELKEEDYLSAIHLRIVYLLLLPFMKNKKIWLFQDKPDVADDNAKHLFSYAIKQKDDIKKYFIVEKDSNSYNEMLKIDKHIVPFDSFKRKILYVFAEKVISSHINHSWLNPFYDENIKFYNGLSSIEKCFLQHGVTKDDVSNWFKKFYKNYYLLVTSSDLERNSILSENYNYDEKVVQTLGFPRFDNLNNHNIKKQILFMPTWRLYLKNDEKKFLQSDFFKNVNGLINNKKLIDFLNQNNYKLLFKLHHGLLDFIDLFDTNEHVEFVMDESYQKLFNESSLLITDYSSVAFDFAYLKKPVIYYQNSPYHYEKGYFEYESMGFGDVIKSEDDLVDKIMDYITNDCLMEEEYKGRVDKFFKFNDKNNCKRVYDWLLSH